ncbi:MAG: HmuY family protein [Muribaculaceae bacterium]|nr:HmuY family protein [Muribaculaceae bacterium]
MKFLKITLATVIVILLPGCEGILGGIYDLAESDNTFGEGFHQGASPNRCTLQIDATSYDEWIYIDLHTKKIQRMPIPKTLNEEWDGISGLTYQLVEGTSYTQLTSINTDCQPQPDDWDFAIHHFDVKTNNGAAANTVDSIFYADEWTNNQVIVDMREMMGMKIGYQRSLVNKTLSSWVTMDISSPPPVYSASGDTYILKMQDGGQAQMRLESYISPKGTKGFLTIDIVYPL